MRNEGRGNYFDRWERGEYSIDPRDLVPYVPPVEFGTRGMIDRSVQAVAVEPARIERPVVEERVLIAA